MESEPVFQSESSAINQDPVAKRANKVEEGKQVGKTILPAARVSRIMKADRDIEMLSKDAIFLISKAAELFIEKLAKSAHTNAAQGGRKTVQYKDLSSAIQQDETYFYLQEVIPAPIPLSDALNKRAKKRAAEKGTATDDERDTLPPQPPKNPVVAPEAETQFGPSSSLTTAPAVPEPNGEPAVPIIAEPSTTAPVAESQQESSDFPSGTVEASRAAAMEF